MPLYYLAGIVLAALALMGAVRSWVNGQREKWITQGSREASLDTTLRNLDTTTRANTEAVATLTEEMHGFANSMAEVRQTLNGHSAQLQELQRKFNRGD